MHGDEHAFQRQRARSVELPRGRAAENNGRSSILSSPNADADRPFRSAQDFTRPPDDCMRKPGELRDLDTVRTVCGAGLPYAETRSLVPLGDVHRDVGDAVETPRQRRQLVIVGRE